MAQSRHLEVFYPENFEETEVEKEIHENMEHTLGEIRLQNHLYDTDEVDLFMYDDEIELQNLDGIIATKGTLDGEFWHEDHLEYSVVETKRGPDFIGENSRLEFALYRNNDALIDLVDGMEADEVLTEGPEPECIYKTVEEVLVSSMRDKNGNYKFRISEDGV